MTDQRARAEQVLNQWLDMQPRALRRLPDPFALNALIAAALADERRRVWEEAKLIADTVAAKHPAPEDWMARLAAVSISNLMDAKAHAGQEG